MSIPDLERSKRLREVGSNIGREGMSLAAIKAVEEWDKSYKGVMILAGRLKAIAQMAKCDDYWDEQVMKGYMREFRAHEDAKIIAKRRAGEAEQPPPKAA